MSKPHHEIEYINFGNNLNDEFPANELTQITRDNLSDISDMINSNPNEPILLTVDRATKGHGENSFSYIFAFPTSSPSIKGDQLIFPSSGYDIFLGKYSMEYKDSFQKIARFKENNFKPQEHKYQESSAHYDDNIRINYHNIKTKSKQVEDLTLRLSPIKDIKICAGIKQLNSFFGGQPIVAYQHIAPLISYFYEFLDKRDIELNPSQPIPRSLSIEDFRRLLTKEY